MKKIYSLSFLCLLGANTLWAQVPANIANKLDRTYDSLCAKLNIKGSAAAVLIPNMGIWKRSYGISHEGVPATNEMLFTLGSNTKTYTSSVVLKLHELKLLSLSDTIGKWFTNNPNINGKITITQLLNHTSGVASYTENAAFWELVNADLTKKWTPEEIVPYIPAPSFALGTRWEYSNSNFLLAGLIIKQVTGKSLANAYQTYIYTPLNITNTKLLSEETTNAEVAHHWSVSIGFAKLTDWEQLGLSYDAMNSVAWAAGGLYATADDNAQFMNGLFNTNKIISDSMLAKLKTTRSIGSGAGYGLGIFSYNNFNGRTVYGHGGTNVGGINENIFDPITKVSISVLTNQDSIDNNTILTRVVFNLHKDLVALKVGVNELNNDTKTQVDVFPNPSQGLVNIQSNEPIDNLTVTNLNGKTVLALNNLNTNNLPIDISHLNQGVYFISGVTNQGTFVQKIVLSK